ncbi:MAG: LLM class flavin-dependent oxidoreductase [Actinomycetota bacterium]|nr:LLM class flavin-dependent oxidoreductase [Actinomycetota bacterium]
MEYRGFNVGEQIPGLSAKENYEHTLRLIGMADAMGIDGWFLAEHHANPGFSLVASPNLLLAVAAERTSRIHLGALVTVLPYHHPLRVAEEIRMLDVLTDGRLEIGFGRGAIRHEQAAYGVDRNTTAELFEDGMELLLRLLTERDVEFENKWWHGTVAEVVPAAVQQPYPDMWIVAVSASSIDRAARYGAHAAVSLTPMELARKHVARYEEAWRQHQGDAPRKKFSFGITIAIGETHAEAERYAREPLQIKAENFLNQISDRPKGDDPAYAEHEKGWRDFVDSSFEDMISSGLIVYGSVDESVEQLQRIIAECGADAITFVPQFIGLDPEFAARSVELFAKEVIPRADPSRYPQTALASQSA